MKRFSVWFILLLWLTACGTTITIQLPERATDLPTATASQTVHPSATAIAGLNAATTANVNFRSAPNTNNTPITVVLAERQVRLTGRIADSTWVFATLSDGRQGWMYAQNLAISGNVAQLPIITPQVVPTATAGPTIDPTPTRETGFRISYNINGEAVPDMAYLMQEMTTNCRTTALVMGNLGLAVQLKRACPETIVVARSWSHLEGDEWFYRSPQNFVDQWKREGYPEIVRHSTNEPSFGRGAKLQEFVRAEIELMRLAREAGFTVAMGNFSVGIFEASDIGAGLFDSYIRALHQYGHYLGLHEYSLGVLAFGTGQWPPECLLDRLCVQPERWPTANQLPVRMVRQDGINQFPPYWYFRRGDWWLLRADQIGVPRPRILVTEFGWDNLPNIKPVIEPLRSQFGLDRYFDDMRGVNTYVNLWRWYWPQWDFSTAACKQLLWADSIYPSDYIGFMLFTWSTNPHWLQTDFSGRENPAHFQLHNCLEAA